MVYVSRLTATLVATVASACALLVLAEHLVPSEDFIWEQNPEFDWHSGWYHVMPTPCFWEEHYLRDKRTRHIRRALVVEPNCSRTTGVLMKRMGGRVLPMGNGFDYHKSATKSVEFINLWGRTFEYWVGMTWAEMLTHLDCTTTGHPNPRCAIDNHHSERDSAYPYRLARWNHDAVKNDWWLRSRVKF